MKKLTKDQQVRFDDYRRSNKTRRPKLLEKWGFSSEESYYESVGFTGRTNKSKGSAPSPAVPATKPEKTKRSATRVEDDLHPPMDYVIAFDTTGSMGSYIASVRAHVKDLVLEMFRNSPNLRIKIVAFGDYCDMNVNAKNGFGKAYQTIELTNDVEKLVEFVKNAENTSGGDEDEFYELVIKKINEETDWRPDARKAVLFIADYEPHKKGYSFGKVVQNNQIEWENEARKAAAMGIQYDTLRIIDSMRWYQKLSEITGGVSLPFKSSGKISHIAEASVYARTSKSAMSKKIAEAEASGDTELVGALKSFSTLK